MERVQQIEDYFKEHIESFTIYIVDLEFAMNRGHEFFKQYISKENFINSNDKMENFIRKILSWTQKKIPNIAELITILGTCKSDPTSTGMIEIITALNKVFTITEHQAAGLNVIDPIIIEEKNINSRLLGQLVALHRESILQPAIIIILKDNNLVRAKKLVSCCPNGINVKFINNAGYTEIFKVVNNGASDIDSFIDAFTRQCFSTCSQTDRGILVHPDWEHQSLLEALSPIFFKVRTNLLYDEKAEAITDLNNIISQIHNRRELHKDNKALLDSFEMIAKLHRVYCNDFGGNDIIDAFNIAKELDIDLLKAQVYRYSQFIPNLTRDTQKKLLLEAKDIFSLNGVADHSVYCENNFLVHSFYGDKVNPRLFRDLQIRATNEVPGMVGMSIIFNNTGVAYLYKKDYDEAVSFFTKGLDYAKERIVQKLGLKNNMLIAKACAYQTVDEKEIMRLLDQVFANFNKNYLPFIAANCIVNMLLIVLTQHHELALEILENHKVYEILSSSLKDGMLGTGSLTHQLVFLNSHFPETNLINLPMPRKTTLLSGIRAEFIEQHGYNPMIFNAWL